MPAKRETTLDPENWTQLRTQAHRMLDDMLDYTKDIRKRPVWQPIPSAVRAHRNSPVPRTPSHLADVHGEFMQYVLPYTVGNVHPGFMGWVHGGGTAVGMLGEMLAAGLNANLGGRDHIPVEVEREVVRWAGEIVGFPRGASGLFVTGTSQANLIAVVVAREAALGNPAHGRGAAEAAKQLTAYASSAVHGSIAKAIKIAGLGWDALRLIPADCRHRMDLSALHDAIQKDREAGLTPFLVVGTAGTANTGAVDDLAGLADLCQREKIWFHVDGAYGALAKLAPEFASRLEGMERADSLAFDFHKWGQVPYDAGVILVRDSAAHQRAFALPADYLARAQRGMAAGSPWPCDFGPDMSRGFRALKVWFTLKVYGTDALGEAISHNCQLARYLERRIAETPRLELLAPVELNIVCFRYCSQEPDSVNQQIVIALQESGIVAPSTTRISGQVAIRAAIVNHRTSRAEIDALIDGVLAFGNAIESIAVRNQFSAKRKTAPSHRDLCRALRIVEQRLWAQPGSVPLLFQRGNLLELTDRKPEALESYRKLLEFDPAHPGALNNMGSLLIAGGEDGEAHDAFSRAVAASPGDPMCEVGYANSLRKRGNLEKAREHFEIALKTDPDYWQAHLGMSSVLRDLNRTEDAYAHRRAAFRGRCIVPLTYRGKQSPITVLELTAIGPGNTRFTNFLSDSIYKRYLVAAEFYEPGAPLPPHQIVVNAIGDADAAAPALRGARALVDHAAAPVMNRPEAVLATGRCEIARRLSGLPGVITAKTVILPKASLAAPNATDRLLERGFAFPLLLRAPGFHQGEHFLRVESGDELPAALEALPGSELMVIQYLDARRRDGKSRKYRAMTIDGQLYPLHAAVSQQWKIHYFSAEMAESAEHRAEDREFLQNMTGVLGPRALSALQAIQKNLGLDYGGIDFGLNEAGDVLVFEANATMAVIPPAEDARWDYRRPAVARVCQAVHAMLDRMAQQARAEMAVVA
ncbi:MAG: aminotransferase class I/II-fold pyridoxal phosphate-dependent enzyme [Terracidiphilus sp.]